MKKSMITLLAMTLVAYGFSQEIASNNPSPALASTAAVFAWTETSHDFGKTKVGVPVSYEFRFTNNGTVPLIISSVKASCGCTVTAYTKDPVEKNASGFVRATYDAKKAGKFSKTVAVYANTPEGMVHLTVKGEIVE